MSGWPPRDLPEEEEGLRDGTRVRHLRRDDRFAGKGLARLVGHVDVGRVESERLDDGLGGRICVRDRGCHEYQGGAASPDGAGRRPTRTQLRAAHERRSRNPVSLQLPHEPAGAKTRISQTVEVGGPLGPALGWMLGPQVSREFGTLLSNLARKAETT